jgi:hypothetical protein
VKFSRHNTGYSIISSFISHKTSAVNKLNLFTNKVQSTDSRNYFYFHVSSRLKKETQKKTVENMCIEKKNNSIYRERLWGKRGLMPDVKRIKEVLIPATLIDRVRGFPQCKNKW